VLAALGIEGAGECEHGLECAGLAVQEPVGLFEMPRGRRARAERGDAELEQHLAARVRCGRLCEGPLEIRPGGVGCVLTARVACGLAQGRDDGSAAPRARVQQMDGDPLGAAVALGEQLGGSLVSQRSFGVAQIGVDGGSEDGVHESQRAPCAEDLDAGERGGRRRRLLGVEHGEGGSRREVTVVAEDCDCARECLRRRTEAPQSPQHSAGQRLGA
jgi:hypothetical protein